MATRPVLNLLFGWLPAWSRCNHIDRHAGHVHRIDKDTVNMLKPCNKSFVYQDYWVKMTALISLVLFSLLLLRAAFLDSTISRFINRPKKAERNMLANIPSAILATWTIIIYNQLYQGNKTALVKYLVAQFSASSFICPMRSQISHWQLKLNWQCTLLV